MEAAPVTLRGVEVLAVDDDQDSRELVLLILRAAGADVMVVSSASTALGVSTVSSRTSSSAISPCRASTGTPLMRGLRRARFVARSRGDRDDMCRPDDIRTSSEAGFALHLSKPADYARLVRAIAERVAIPGV